MASETFAAPGLHLSPGSRLGLVADRYVPAGGVGLRGVGQDARVACGDAPGGPCRSRCVQHVDRDPPQGLVVRHQDAFPGEQRAPLRVTGRRVLRVLQGRSSHPPERKFRMHLVQWMRAAQPVFGGLEKLAAQPPRLGAASVPGQVAAQLIRGPVGRRLPDRCRRDREDRAPARAERGPRLPVGRAPAAGQQASGMSIPTTSCAAVPASSSLSEAAARTVTEPPSVEIDADPAVTAAVHAGDAVAG